MTGAQVQDLLYADCGLKGLSGISNDVRDLEASADPRARFALDYFDYRVGLQAGLLTAGLDGFVFTAGIGKNSPGMRARIVERLAWLGCAPTRQAQRRSPRTAVAPVSMSLRPTRNS
jgi:acetate kinase